MPMDDGKLRRRESHRRKDGRFGGEERKEGSSMSPMDTRKSLRASMCLVGKGGEKRGHEKELRRKREEKSSKERGVHSRKGLSTFSHDTICCRRLTNNASASAKICFPALSRSSLVTAPSRLRENFAGPPVVSHSTQPCNYVPVTPFSDGFPERNSGNFGRAVTL